jgi:plasmid maintenance system antidote protein VapI
MKVPDSFFKAYKADQSVCIVFAKVNHMQKDYREMIVKEFLRRRSLEVNFTQEMFARYLGIKPDHLCRILKGEKGLSKINAFVIGRRIGLSINEAKEFRFLVSAQSGKSRYERNLAKQRLEKGQSKKIL